MKNDMAQLTLPYRFGGRVIVCLKASTGSFTAPEAMRKKRIPTKARPT